MSGKIQACLTSTLPLEVEVNSPAKVKGRTENEKNEDQPAIHTCARDYSELGSIGNKGFGG
jgi:hypothetical protein